MNLSKPLITSILLALTACDDPDQDASTDDELASGLRACVQDPSASDVVDCARVLFADDSALRCGEPLPPPKGCYYKSNVLVCPPKVVEDPQEDRLESESAATSRSPTQIGNKTIRPPAGPPEPLTLDPPRTTSSPERPNPRASSTMISTWNARRATVTRTACANPPAAATRPSAPATRRAR